MTTAIESEAITTLNPQHAEFLTHMLGAGKHYPRKKHGFRNYFCAGIEGDDHRTLVAMAAAGLVQPGHTINQGTSQYFFATKAGCQAIGLHKAAILRALKQD